MIPIGVTAAGLATAFRDGRLRPFRFTDEGWFGSGTYAGGADKAAHFVNYTILNIRVPFTAVGFQYGLNRGRWYWPGNGNQYSTTP